MFADIALSTEAVALVGAIVGPLIAALVVQWRWILVTHNQQIADLKADRDRMQCALEKYLAPPPCDCGACPRPGGESPPPSNPGGP